MCVCVCKYIYPTLSHCNLLQTGEYESMQKVRRNFGCSEHKAAWQ